MRIAVSPVVNVVANGSMYTTEMIAKTFAEYPALEPEDIHQARLYAASAALRAPPRLAALVAPYVLPSSFALA